MATLRRQVLLFPSDQPGDLLAVHVLRFPSARARWTWVNHAKRSLPSAPGLVFAKALGFIGSSSSAGFGVGLPDLRSLVLVSAWRGEDDFVAYTADARALQTAGAWVLGRVVTTRGSHYARRPLTAAPARHDASALGVLTLGRAAPQRLTRFLREGVRLNPHRRGAAGLIAAVSAGSPLTGNCTFSLWRSQRHMLDFAYSEPDGHGKTARAQPPILREQLNARVQPLRLGGRWRVGVADASALDDVSAELA